MGMQQPHGFDTSWEVAAELLDDRFPLSRGSHRTAAGYIVHHDHLLVIDASGACTGLARPTQFVEADGDEQAPTAIVLEHEGLQVEIEPTRRAATAHDTDAAHRLQLQVVLAAA